MKKRVMSLVFAAMMVLAIVPALGQEARADSSVPHFFASALREFFSDNPAVSSAVLYDLDGDGNLEVVAVKGNKNDITSITRIVEIVIFDIENGKNISVSHIAGEDPIDWINRIYISDTNYLVMDIDISHYKPSFYQYRDGKISKKVVTSLASDEPTQYFDFETGNLIPEEQLSQYIGTIANYTTVYSEGAYFGEKPHVDQTEEIYAMTVTALTASPTSSAVLVNGEQVSFDAYNIKGNNYFKLRDIAYILNGTQTQFEVEWDAANNDIKLTSGRPYTPNGSEMTSKGSDTKTASPTTSKIYLDGKEVTFTAYNIGGNNYFKLRDIGTAFDFGVTWDGGNSTIIIDTEVGYTPE